MTKFVCKIRNKNAYKNYIIITFDILVMHFFKILFDKIIN